MPPANSYVINEPPLILDDPKGDGTANGQVTLDWGSYRAQGSPTNNVVTYQGRQLTRQVLFPVVQVISVAVPGTNLYNGQSMAQFHWSQMQDLGLPYSYGGGVGQPPIGGVNKGGSIQFYLVKVNPVAPPVQGNPNAPPPEPPKFPPDAGAPYGRDQYGNPLPPPQNYGNFPPMYVQPPKPPIDTNLILLLGQQDAARQDRQDQQAAREEAAAARQEAQDRAEREERRREARADKERADLQRAQFEFQRQQQLAQQQAQFAAQGIVIQPRPPQDDQPRRRRRRRNRRYE